MYQNYTFCVKSITLYCVKQYLKNYCVKITGKNEFCGILPAFKGILCHDNWKAYYAYQNCKHSLCNAHHLRELQAAIDIDKCDWAKQMQDLLCEINDRVNEAD